MVDVPRPFKTPPDILESLRRDFLRDMAIMYPRSSFPKGVTDSQLLDMIRVYIMGRASGIEAHGRSDEYEAFMKAIAPFKQRVVTLSRAWRWW